MRLSVPALSTFAATALMAGGALAADQTLSGSVAYKDRSALPPGAVLDVALVDISRMDAPAVTLSSRRWAIEGQVPVDYSLTFDDALIDERMSYAVQATIGVEGKTLYRNTTVTPALTRGAGNEVDIMVDRVAMEQAGAGGDLAGSEWVVTDFGGPILVTEKKPEIAFGEDGRISGFTGCNRLMGSFETDGGSISFGQGGMTMMACPEPYGEMEQKFNEQLALAQSYTLTGDTLVLGDENGRAVMRLVRKP
ncbi:YbaY family lipoprotein [Pseudoruegeria sp. SHC-113]|uniref:YbaY family lipoprotein n=1 Tax=Pseudoruegeria sp. SHC-113 TaxID=2855439 RepID=UPI0021BAFEEE|nr:YbaY family lipoprotein [Pseudoruegeria sp. SHC-113]MCT8161570.1 YbaY family lipoprotein [Pseudoruegeria sp. SHC-113]